MKGINLIKYLLPYAKWNNAPEIVRLQAISGAKTGPVKIGWHESVGWFVMRTTGDKGIFYKEKK